MMDSEGRITTYYAKCTNYSPMKDKPTGVIDTVLGQTYECSKFEYDQEQDKKGLYLKDIKLGQKFCFVCKHYTGNVEANKVINNEAKERGLFLSYELSVKLKEKGFDEPCWAWYNIPDQDIRPCYSEQRSPITNTREDWDAKNEKREVEIIGLPMYQQVVDWLREKQGILITQENRSKHLVCSVLDTKGRNGNGTYDNFTTTVGETPTEALNKAIEEALKLI